VRVVARSVLWGCLSSILAVCFSGCAASGIQEFPTPTVPPDLDGAGASQEQALPIIESGEPDAAPTAEDDAVLFDQVVALDETQGNPVEVDFEVSAFQAIRLALNPIDGGVAYDASLVDPHGIALFSDSAPPGSALLVDEFTLPYAGAYRLFLSASDGAGSVQVQGAALSERTGGAIFDGVGGSETGVFAGGHVYHAFLIPLIQGEVVDLLVEPELATGLGLSMNLYRPDGGLTAAAGGNGENASVMGFSAPMTGEYTAIVSNTAGSAGSYTFSVAAHPSPPAEGAPDITYGREYTAEFFADSVLSVTFDGAMGDGLRVDVVEPDPQLDVDIYLYSPYRQVIAYAVDAGSGEAESIAEVQLPYTGRYRLELRPSGSGAASFIVNPLAQSDLSGGGVFAGEQGGVLSGRFEQPGVFHSYQFHADEGDPVRLSITAHAYAEELEMAVVVLGPDGAQFAYADAAAGMTPTAQALGEWQLTQTGTYTIVVYSLNGVPGTYQLELERDRSGRP
jgi:hypothetical protein